MNYFTQLITNKMKARTQNNRVEVIIKGGVVLDTLSSKTRFLRELKAIEYGKAFSGTMAAKL